MVLRWYQARLAARPLLTQAATTAVLFGAGDALAQHAVEKRGLEKHSWARTARMVGYGGLVFGPAATKWYQILSKHVVLQSKTATTVARVLADQTVFATTNMAFFLSTMAYLEGESVQKKLEKAYIPGLKANWALWPAVQFVNFTYVPLEHRVLIVNITACSACVYNKWCNCSRYMGSKRPGHMQAMLRTVEDALFEDPHDI